MRAVVFLVVALLAAGCVGREDAPVAPGSTAASSASIEPSIIVDPLLPGGGATALALDVPVWQLGDAWDIESIDGESEPSRSTFVVTAVGPDSYTLSTTSDRLAGYDAMFDVSYVGQVRANDLAGSQQGQPVKYFDFPLTDEKTWSTPWDHTTVTLKAAKTAKGFDIVGTDADGAPYVVYDFAPSLKWWSHIDFAAGYGFTVQRFQQNWKGEFVTATAKSLFEESSAAPVANPATGSFTVDEGQTYVLVSISGGGAAWARAFALVQPDGQPYMTETIQNAEVAGDSFGYSYEERLPPMAGAWQISAPMAHEPEGFGSVLVHEVVVTPIAFS